MDHTDSFLSQWEHERRAGRFVVPSGFDELEQAAADALPAEVFEYATGGAGSGSTKRANRAGFDRWRIVPRVFRDVTERDLHTEFLGMSLSAPVVLAPIGVQAAFDAEGELASARAAASFDIPFTLSAASSRSIETVAEEVPDSPRLFQLYWTADWDVTASLVQRADRAGYDAIVVTVDFQIPRWMPQASFGTDEDSVDIALANFATDPVATRKGVSTRSRVGRDRSVTWEDLSFLREQTELPILVKGILHPEDARSAIEHGADGIVVSNHGGRQIDGALGAITALPEIVSEVNGDVPIMFDSGVRSGADVFKALALGADAVGIGRPYVYGLAIASERGVSDVLLHLLAELDSVVGLAGHDTVRALNRSALTTTVD